MSKTRGPGSWHGDAMLVAPGVVLDPALKAAGDSAVFWRVPRLGLDCLRARFRRHAYARHTHETYALAAILEGCETFFHRGRQHYATPGAIALVGPDELHDGAPHDERGFVSRTLYPSVDLIARSRRGSRASPSSIHRAFASPSSTTRNSPLFLQRRIGRWSVRTSRCFPAMRGL